MEGYLIALGVSIALMILVYLIALKINNFSIVDIAWSYMFGVVALVLYNNSEGYWPRKLFITLMVLFWSFRLGTHLLIRIKEEHPEEEGRYKELRRKWASNLKLNFFKFFMFQAVSVSFLATPLILSVPARSSDKFFIWELLAISIWFIAILGESLADYQLKNFKLEPSNQGKVCDVGLWNYSRHPNYFFEWLIWVSFAIYAIPTPWGWLGFVSPAIILFLLLKVTGIPTTEAQSLRSRGQAYLDYQKTTSMFVPWFKKKSL